ncbi:MAG TPA: Calx-beta domain-containing protein, partial [Pyrinomonadaceae bacterium]|nr:Calx-beta domain-containing protein [Pyrinomonadaceae bacterium]
MALCALPLVLASPRFAEVRNAPLSISSYKKVFASRKTRGLTPTPFTAGTEKDFFQNGDMTSGTNYSPSGLPSNTNDVLLTTSTTALLISGANRAMGTLNQTNNTSYSINNNSGTNNSTLTLGGGGTTDSITGSNGADLIFLGGTSSTLTISGTGSGGKTLGVALAANGNFDVANSGAALTITSIVSGAFSLTTGTTSTGNIGTTIGGKNLTTGTNTALTFSGFNGSTAPLTILGGGSVSLASTNSVTVTTTTPLGVGDYILISKGVSGSVTGTAPSSLTVNGSGLASGTSAVLQITGSQLVLHVTINKYRSKTSGNWNATSTWQSSSDGGSTWVDATATPTSTDDTIEIQSGHTVTVTANVTADQVTVDSGGTLTVNAGVTLSLNDGAGTDLIDNGTLTLPDTAVVGGAGTVAINGTVNIASSDATDGLAAGISASFTLNSGSTVNFNGTGAQTVGAHDYYTLTVSSRASGTVTFGSGTIGIFTSFNPASGVTYAFNSGNAIEYKLTGLTGSSTTTLPPAFTHYNGLKSNEPGNTLGPSGLIVDATLEVAQGTFSSASDYNNVLIDSGATLTLTNDITVSGNWTNNGTLTHNNHKVTFDGTGAQTIATGGTGAGKSFAAVAITKASGTATLAGDLSDTSLTITSGTFDQGASFNLLSGAITVSGGATWRDVGSGNVTLSGGVSNAGTININSGTDVCGETQSITIGSSGGQQAWSGIGTFVVKDVHVANQGGTALIHVENGVSDGGNGVNWIFTPATCTGSTLYTWNPPAPGSDSNYTTAINWTPTRTSPNQDDVLVVDGAVTLTTHLDNIPTETIGRFRFINGTAATLSTGSANTLTIKGDGSNVTDFDVAGFSQVTLSGSNTLTISLASGATGNIDNLLTIQGNGNKLIATDAGAITFPNKTICTVAAGYSGNPFGTGSSGDGANGSVVFTSGSNYFHYAGSSPFGDSSHNVVVFNTGSTANFYTASGLETSGRTYANLVIGDGTNAVSSTTSGTGNFQVDNLTINSTSSANSKLEYDATGTATITIQGNVTSNGAGANNLPDLFLNAPGGFTINKAGGGTITFGTDGSNTRAVVIDGSGIVTSSTTLQLNRILQLGQANVNTKTLAVNIDGALNGSSTGYLIGSLQKSFSSPSVVSQTFQVGSANGYAPIEVANASGTGTLTISSTGAKLGAISGTNALSRYWTIANSGLAQADLTFHYNAGDVQGTESNYKFFRYTGSFTQFNPTSLNATTHVATLNGVTQFSDWTLAEPTAVNPGTVAFVGAPYTTTEGNGTSHLFTVTVSRSGGSDGALDVSYATSDGTATAGSDYVAASSTLHWNAGETGNRTFDITVNEDATYEANETVNILLSNATDTATITPPTQTTLTIVNDDAPPSTLVVNTTDDADNGACLPAHCSLREAINAANSNPDANTINFNIPASFISGGVFTIQPGSALPTITTPMTIDGTSQTAFVGGGGDTNPNGPEIVINGALAGPGV